MTKETVIRMNIKRKMGKKSIIFGSKLDILFSNSPQAARWAKTQTSVETKNAMIRPFLVWILSIRQSVDPSKCHEICSNVIFLIGWRISDIIDIFLPKFFISYELSCLDYFLLQRFKHSTWAASVLFFIIIFQVILTFIYVAWPAYII